MCPTTPDQRSSTRATLEQTIAEHRAVLASALDPIVTIDAFGIIQSASDSLERVFGWKPSEVVGKNVRMLMPEPHHSAHDCYLANYRDTHQTNILGRTREFFAIRRDGTQFPIELSVSRVDVPGASVPWFMGIIHDISERKEIEKELDRSRAHLEDMVMERTAQLEATHEQLRNADRLASIGTLAAGLGHDMNNVLLPIRARLDALDASELPTHARQQFQAVRRSIAYLQQLSDGLHLLVLDPEDREASGGSTDLCDWWKQVGPLLSKAVPKHIKFQVDLADGLPPIALPPHRVTQAALNLVVNAAEATGGKRGAIRFVARVSESKDKVELSVADDGEGMTPEVRKHAMDPFYTTKKRGLGTGLGLSLVHGIVQSAGGDIDIRSELGKGTTVVLSIPLDAHDVRASQGKNQQLAIVSIGDRRAATFVSGMLQSANFSVRIGSDPDLGQSLLWIVERQRASIQAAKQYLRGDRRRRIVLFGPGDGQWESLGVASIDDTSDLDLIRRTLGEAMAGVSDGPTP
jgi:PAS domain S-box-containing protein